MKNKYIVLVCILLCSMGLFAQSSWLAPEISYKTSDVFTDKAFSCHDIIGDSLYAIDSDGLYSYDLITLEQKSNYGKAPANYTGAWVSFVTADPDGKRIWVGYTSSGLTDDRIFSVDIATCIWTHVATLPGNFDMEINDDNYYVSGLNTEGWDGVNDVNCISLLDTTGDNLHKKLIEIGGNSTGLAIDTQGNVYNAKYDPTGTETYMYQWTVDSVQKVIAATDGSFLTINSGNLITAMPNNGPYDCDVDDAGNLLFNCNDFVGGSFLAVWNGDTGNAHNYTKIGTYGGSSFAWFSMLKAKGDITKDGKAYMINFGDPIAEIYLSIPPEVTETLGTVSGYNNDANVEINLNNHFADSDDTEDFFYEIISNSIDSVALATIVDDTLLVIDFMKVGQTNIYVKATSNGQSVSDKLIVGVQPEISGSYIVTDFEDLSLSEESYWNGSDGSGGFVSGLAKFDNNNSGGFWDGWAYSNTTDITTAGYTNQYSAITGVGFDTIASNGKNYGIGYVSTDWVTTEPKPLPIAFTDSMTHSVKGLYVTNSTYASLSMEQGDPFAKKFGGESGNDPDYFKLLVWGKKDGVETDTIDFYLADYRFEDNTKDYIVKTWQWIELSSLGKVDTLLFSLASSDVGMWGINTPLYLNVDNFYIEPDNAPIVVNPIADITEKYNAPDKVVDLSNVFSDEDGDTVTISIHSNSNPEFATASLSDNELTIDFIAEGTTSLIIEGSSNNKSAYDTVLLSVVVDQAPIVVNPIADITEKYNAPNKVVDLSNVFFDADGDTVTISIHSNSNPEFATASLLDNELTIDFIAEGTTSLIIEGSSNNKSAYDTVLLSVVADQAPIVVNPIADVTVSKNSADSVISLANVFTDTDDDDINITKLVKSNSNEALVSANISGDEITLSFTDEVVGEAEIVIEAESNEKVVSDTFLVIVSAASSIEDPSLTDIVLYPNPSNGVFKIKTDNAEKFGIKVYSMQGILIYANDNYSNSVEIDISTQSAGQYILKLNQGISFNTKYIIIK